MRQRQRQRCWRKNKQSLQTDEGRLGKCFPYMQVVEAVIVNHSFNLNLLVPCHRIWQLQVNKEMFPGSDIVWIRNTETYNQEDRIE